MHTSSILTAAGLLVAVTLTSCGPKNTFVEPPAPSVTVRTTAPQDVTTFLEFPGKTEAKESVEVRARVKGFLRSIDFAPGEKVEKGDLLFTIEPESFEAAVEAAEGHLAKAQADLEIATANRLRKEKAFQTNAVAELDVLTAKADEQAAAANVKTAQASVSDAKIDLSYTKITAPITGSVSRNMVDVGNLVGGSEATLLTTVVQDNPIYAYFELSERAILPFLPMRKLYDDPKERARVESGKRGTDKVRLKTANGTVYDTVGEMDFIDNRLDPETGTIRARAVFANTKGALADGLYVNVMIPQQSKGAILVPREAIQRDLAGRYVLTVDADNVVVRQNVTPKQYVDDQQIVEGLQAGQQVIVRGLQRAREGIKVTAKEGKPTPDATPEEKAVEKSDSAHHEHPTPIKKPTDRPTASNA